METPVPVVSFLECESGSPFGNYTMIQSHGVNNKTFSNVRDLNASLIGTQIWIRARLHNPRVKGIFIFKETSMTFSVAGNGAFLTLRQGPYTVQAAAFKSDTIPKEMIKFMDG